MLLVKNLNFVIMILSCCYRITLLVPVKTGGKVAGRLVVRSAEYYVLYEDIIVGPKSTSV